MNAPIQTYDAQYFDTEKFYQYVFLWASLSGVKNLPDDMVVKMVVMFLTEEAAGMTFDEVTEAIKMNVTGRLSEVVEAFNSLDYKYMSRVMILYRKYRKDLEKRFEDVERKEQRVLTAFKPSELQADIIIAAHLVKSLRNYKSGLDLYGHSALYEYLKRYDVTPFSEEEEEERVKSCVEGLHLAIQGKLDPKEYQRLTELSLDEKRLKSWARSRAQEKLLIEYFKQVIDGKLNIVAVLREKFMLLHDLSRPKMSNLLKSIPSKQL